MAENGDFLDSHIESLLRSDHVELDGLLTDVFSALDSGKLDSVHRALDLFWARLAMHIRAEHLRLFPAVLRVADERTEFSDVPDLIERLRHDHDFFMRELARAIKITRESEYENNPLGTVRGILGTVQDGLAVHDRLEEERIYKLATPGLMPPETIRVLAASIKTELDTLPPRFGSATEG